jgi:hypothetical protein
MLPAEWVGCAVDPPAAMMHLLHGVACCTCGAEDCRLFCFGARLPMPPPPPQQQQQQSWVQQRITVSKSSGAKPPFSSVQWRPVQVHRGELVGSGQQVVVKVQLAAARKAMCSDLTNLRIFSNLLTW